MKNVADHAICRRCGKTYAPRSNNAKRCDDCCSFICSWCGKEFASRRNRKVRFCSLACTNAWQDTARDDARRRTLAVRGRGRVLRCITCGEAFYAPGWRLDQYPVKYCSHACRNYPADLKGVKRTLRFPTRNGLNSLERAGKAILNDMGIGHEEQQIIGGKFVVDVLVPDQSLIIQWDGDFWHGNPARYPSLYPIQRANSARDKACNAYLAKCGYRVLRFWESDVHQNSHWVSGQIKAALANSPRT